MQRGKSSRNIVTAVKKKIIRVLNSKGTSGRVRIRSGTNGLRKVTFDGDIMQIGGETVRIDRIQELYIRHDKPGTRLDNVQVEILAKKPESQRTPHGLGNMRIKVGSVPASDRSIKMIEEEFKNIKKPILHY